MVFFSVYNMYFVCVCVCFNSNVCLVCQLFPFKNKENKGAWSSVGEEVGGKKQEFNV